MPASRIVTEIALVMGLEGSGKVASEATEAFGKIKEGYDAQATAAGKAKAATEELTDTQRKAAVEAAKVAEAEEKSARAIAAARKAQAQSEAELSKVKSAQLKGDTLGEAASTAQRAMLTDRADRRADVARMRIDKEADRLDDPGRMAWAEMRKSFAAGPKGSAGWRAVIENAAPGAFENEGLRALAEKRLAFESGQERIQTFGTDAVQRTQDSFDLGVQKKADREREQAERKAAAQKRMKEAEDRRNESLRRRLEADARRVRREAEAAARRAAADARREKRDAAAAQRRVDADKRRDDASKARKEKATTHEFEGARDDLPRAIEAEIKANERLQKAIARTTQERKKGNVEGISAAELAQKHAQHDAEEAARETKDAIARILRTLSEDEREAFVLMEAAVARMTAKGMSEMVAWRLAARRAAKGVREELGNAMQGPNLSGIAKGLSSKADFAAAAAKYRDVASSIDMVDRSAKRATREVKLLNHNLTRGFSRSLSGVNELAGGIGQFASFSFGVFRNATFLVRTLSGVFRGLTDVVLGTVKGVTSLVGGVVHLGTRIGAGFLDAGIFAIRTMTSAVKGLTVEITHAVTGLVRLAERAASSAMHLGIKAMLGYSALGGLASREGWKDANDLADGAEELRKRTSEDQDWSDKGEREALQESRDAAKVQDQNSDRMWKADHPGSSVRGGSGRGGEREPDWKSQDHGMRYVRGLGGVNNGWDSDVRQVFDGLAQQLDVPMDALKAGMDSLAKEIRAGAQDPGGEDAQMFRMLGVQLTERDAQGREQARKVYDVFLDVSRSLQRMSLPAGQAEVILKNLFGSDSTAKALNPMMKSVGGQDGLRQEEERQKRLGTFVSKADIEQTKAFKKVVQETRDAIKGLRMEIGRQLMPFVQGMAQRLTGFIVAHRVEIARWVTEFVERFVSGTVRAAQAIGQIIQTWHHLADPVIAWWRAHSDGVGLVVHAYAAGLRAFIVYEVLIVRYLNNITAALGGVHGTVPGRLFGYDLKTLNGWVHAISDLEDWTIKAGKAVVKFFNEGAAAMGGWAAIGNGLKGAAKFVLDLGKALLHFAKAHGLDHGDTWVRFFGTIAKAVGDAYNWVAPKLKAFARDLMIVPRGDEWAARDSKVLTKLVELRNRLVNWAKKVLVDLKNVFLNGKDADGIQTWAGSVAKWMMWVVSKLPEWWEKIKAAYQEGSDFVRAVWKALVQIVRGEQTDYPWLNRLVEHIKHLIEWIKTAVNVFEAIHGAMEKFREATGWDLESGLMFIAIAKMSGLLGIATGAWKLLTGGIQATAGVLQAFIALCRGDLAGVVGIIGRALGLTSVVEGAGGMAAGGAAAAGGMVGMGPAGAAVPLGMGTVLPGAMSAGVLGAAAVGGAWSVNKMHQNADEENQHIADMQDLRNALDKAWAGVAHGLFEELDRVRRIADGNLNDGTGSESWRRDFNSTWKYQGSQAAKTIAQKFNLRINGDDVLNISEEGLTKMLLNNRYRLQSETPYQ